jgi:hypothetical protein
MIALTHAYGLSHEPFSPDIPVAELFTLPGLQAFLGRFTYAVSFQQGGATERVGCRTVTVPSLGRVAAPPGRAAGELRFRHETDLQVVTRPDDVQAIETHGVQGAGG